MGRHFRFYTLCPGLFVDSDLTMWILSGISADVRYKREGGDTAEVSKEKRDALGGVQEIGFAFGGDLVPISPRS